MWRTWEHILLVVFVFVVIVVVLKVSKLLGLSQVVVGNPRWAFGGCCTAVLVPLGI